LPPEIEQLPKPDRPEETHPGERHVDEPLSDEPRPAEASHNGNGLKRIAGNAAGGVKRTYNTARMEWRRARWQTRDSWRQLTNGLELNELWSQFKHEAHVSTRLYKQDAGLRDLPAERSWRQPFRVAAALFLAILAKLSPARRVFLLATLVVAVMAAVGFEFLFITKQVEFVVAFGGLLLLLLLVLGDHDRSFGVIEQLLDQHVARLLQCRRCPRMLPPPVSGGPVLSKVMLIGQAPGVKEPVLGKPFAWTAGRTLFGGGSIAAGFQFLHRLLLVRDGHRRSDPRHPVRARRHGGRQGQQQQCEGKSHVFLSGEPRGVSPRLWQAG